MIGSPRKVNVPLARGRLRVTEHGGDLKRAQAEFSRARPSGMPELVHPHAAGNPGRTRS
jgi:hypothetical protein